MKEEKKKNERIARVPPQILHSSLAAFWYGACPAFIMPPVCIGSSLHLPIFLSLIRGVFLLSNVERKDV